MIKMTLFKALLVVIIYSAEFIEIKDEGSWANLNKPELNWVIAPQKWNCGVTL